MSSRRDEGGDARRRDAQGEPSPFWKALRKRDTRTTGGEVTKLRNPVRQTWTWKDIEEALKHKPGRQRRLDESKIEMRKAEAVKALSKDHKLEEFQTAYNRGESPLFAIDSFLAKGSE